MMVGAWSGALESPGELTTPMAGFGTGALSLADSNGASSVCRRGEVHWRGAYARCCPSVKQQKPARLSSRMWGRTKARPMASRFTSGKEYDFGGAG